MTLPEFEFEWDDAKAELNFVKHGVDFVIAAFCFENELLQWMDDRQDYGELRMIALGRANADIYRVVYTHRDPNTIRIITAQKASRHERERYYREIFHQ